MQPHLFQAKLSIYNDQNVPHQYFRCKSCNAPLTRLANKWWVGSSVKILAWTANDCRACWCKLLPHKNRMMVHPLCTQGRNFLLHRKSKEKDNKCEKKTTSRKTIHVISHRLWTRGNEFLHLILSFFAGKIPYSWDEHQNSIMNITISQV